MPTGARTAYETRAGARCASPCFVDRPRRGQGRNGSVAPSGLAIPATDQGAQVCLNVVGNNTQDHVTWVHSYVTRDQGKTFCIYDASAPEAIRRAAQRNSLPMDNITEVSVLDPYFYH